METLSSIFNFLKKEVTSFLRNVFAVLQNFMGGNAIKFKQKAIFSKLITLKCRVAIFAFLLVLGVGGNAWGQTVVSIGGAGYYASYIGPAATQGRNYTSTVSLYRGTGTTDLTTWGYITAVGWNYDYSNSTSTGTFNHYINELYFKNFTGATLTSSSAQSTYTSGVSSVFSGTYSLSGSNGYKTIALSTPWLLSSAQNFTVLTTVPYTNAIDTYFFGDATTSLSGAVQQNSVPSSVTQYPNQSYRAAIQLTFGLPSFTTQPAATSSLCSSSVSPVTLSVVSTITTSYQWQYSVNGSTGWSSVADGTPTSATYANSTTKDLSVSGISSAGTYYYRCIAYNGNGASCIAYSSNNALTVATCCSAPTVAATTTQTSVTQCSASTGGNVTADGGCAVTARGVCYGTATAPTTANSTLAASGTTGSFTSSLTGLAANTLYYVRAYATNSSGTTYGTQISFTTSAAATTYYSASSGNLELKASWGTNTDGTGCSPPNFTTASTTYIITNRTTATIGANWVVSGTSSKVIVGQASSAAVTFTVPNNYTYTGTIDVAAASSGSNTLVLYHTTVPTLGTLNIGSTVKFNASDIQTIPVNTYGNLETGVELAGSTNYTKTAANNLDINGNLTLGDYSTLALSSFSHTLAGDFIKPTGNGILNAGTSTLTFDGASTQKIHVTTAGGTTPCDADVTYNNLVINGTDVKLYYNQVTNRKMNIVDLTVNTSKVLTLFSAP